MNARKAVTLVFFAAVLGMGYYSMNAAPVVSSDNSTFQGGLEWHTNPETAFDLAAEQDKPILVYYWTTWCTYCDDYDSTHYRNETIRDELDDYVLLAINLDEPGAGTSLLQQHEATYPPQHRILRPDGETVVSVEGYAEPDQFYRIVGRGVASGNQEFSGPQSTNSSEAN